MNFNKIMEGDIVGQMTAKSLFGDTRYTSVAAFKDEGISSFMVGLAINVNIKAPDQPEPTPYTFNVHLDISKRFGESMIQFANLTPRQTTGFLFFDWLCKSAGKDFVNSYVKMIFDALELQHFEPVPTDSARMRSGEKITLN